MSECAWAKIWSTSGVEVTIEAHIRRVREQMLVRACACLCVCVCARVYECV